MVNAMANLGILIGDVLRAQSAIDGFPARASIIGTECARGRDGDINPLRIAGIENDSVQAHTAGPWLPFGTCPMPTQSRELLPAAPTIGRAEQRSVFDSGIEGIGIGE